VSSASASFGMTLVIVYLINISRTWRGKVQQVYHQPRTVGADAPSGRKRLMIELLSQIAGGPADPPGYNPR
jgi:hypothetical protein